MNIADNKEYFGKMIHNWTSEMKNKYVITGFIAGKENIANNRVGKVVQVRIDAGDYGSDCVLLRHKDDTLTPHENQSFWLIPDKFNDYLDEIFKDVSEDDSDNYAYTLQGTRSEKGFIIKSTLKDDEPSPMRDIKKAILNKLNESL
ncbi:hypothetical protein RCH18_002079 [Flavobacterium sp. PL11]|jgi:hypothetical protein|uniref:hypothetical protein n=1 Tax=Flavobacterium sp. PL11 TaxID=3071717 RepID=UPI002DFCE813|nr:hypothetical protein [Flavobacterium sp. PL11]